MALAIAHRCRAPCPRARSPHDRCSPPDRTWARGPRGPLCPPYSESVPADPALVGVTLKPWRPGLPFMQLGVIIANRHLDLRQTLLVEDFVLRDHLVQEEQVGRQRIDLIGGESPLIPRRQAAIDVIPHRRRKPRAQWPGALPLPEWDKPALFLFLLPAPT